MALTLIWVGLIVRCLACAVYLFRRSVRPASCPDCGVTAEILTGDARGPWGPVVEIAHWCPRCARVIVRRFVTLLCE
jgi:predicted RNA-binding Zn-ribbon protein involved in translation (DUF1610 family)